MKGILFKEDMFKGVINRIKTETRRIIPDKELVPDEQLTPEVLQFLCDARARYKVDDIVYLKEPYFLNTIDLPVYKYLNEEWEQKAKDKANFIPTWKNKLFMPAKSARYFIKITEVKAERLGSITEEAAISEGVGELSQSSMQLAMNGRQFVNYFNKKELFNQSTDARNSFLSLWAKINGYESLTKNPWVFVYKFELLSPSETNKQIKDLSII